MKQLIEVRLTIEQGKGAGTTLYRDVVVTNSQLPNTESFIEDMWATIVSPAFEEAGKKTFKEWEDKQNKTANHDCHLSEEDGCDCQIQ